MSELKWDDSFLVGEARLYAESCHQLPDGGKLVYVISVTTEKKIDCEAPYLDVTDLFFAEPETLEAAKAACQANEDALDAKHGGKAELVHLKDFVRAIVRTRCWGWNGEEDGGTIQDLAEKHGIIVPFEATQKHFDSGFLNENEIGIGDTAFKFSDWFNAIANSKGSDA